MDGYGEKLLHMYEQALQEAEGRKQAAIRAISEATPEQIYEEGMAKIANIEGINAAVLHAMTLRDIMRQYERQQAQE